MMYQNKYNLLALPLLDVFFYRSASGSEPVRDWLTDLPRGARKIIGEDIKTVQYGWPLGMPVVRKLERGVWEVRSHIQDGVARVLFTVDGTDMVSLLGLIKKTQKTPTDDLIIARRRYREVHHG